MTKSRYRKLTVEVLEDRSLLNGTSLVAPVVPLPPQGSSSALTVGPPGPVVAVESHAHSNVAGSLVAEGSAPGQQRLDPAPGLVVSQRSGVGGDLSLRNDGAGFESLPLGRRGESLNPFAAHYEQIITVEWADGPVQFYFGRTSEPILSASGTAGTLGPGQIEVIIITVPQPAGVARTGPRVDSQGQGNGSSAPAQNEATPPLGLTPGDQPGLANTDAGTLRPPAASGSSQIAFSWPNGLLALPIRGTNTTYDRILSPPAQMVDPATGEDGGLGGGRPAVIPTPEVGPIRGEAPTPFSGSNKPGESLSPLDLAHLLPQYAGLFTNVLPFDLGSLESDVQGFFDRIGDLGIAMPGARVDFLVGSGLLAAATALAVEMARRQWQSTVPALTAGEGEHQRRWIPPADGI